MESLQINVSSGLEINDGQFAELVGMDNLVGGVGSIRDEFAMDGGLDVFSSFLENGGDVLGNETETGPMMDLLLFNQLNLNRDEETRQKSGKTGYVVLYFMDDEAAQSTDPKVMESNFRIPMRKVLRKECVGMVDQCDGHELVMSQEFAMKRKYGVDLEVENIEQYRGRNKTCTPDSMKRMIIKRTSPIHGICNIHRVGRIQAKGSKVMKNLRKKNLDRSSRNFTQKKTQGVMLKRNDATTPNRVQTNSAAHTSSPSMGEIKPKLEVDKADCDHLIIATLKGEDGEYPVSFGSVKSLIPKRYLNDEVMDFGIFNILKRVHPHPDAAYVASFAWLCYFFKDEGSTGLSDTLYRIMTKKGKRPDLLITRKYLVIPVVRETHWLLVIVCNPFPSSALIRAMEADTRPHIHLRLYHQWASGLGDAPPKILIFDSMYYNLISTCGNLGTFHADTAKYIRQGLHGLHLMFWKEKGAYVDVPYFSEHILGHKTVVVPQQSNKEDCGLFCMAYVSHFFTQLKELKGDYIQLSMRDCRNWFGDSLSGWRTGLYQLIKDECKKANPDHVYLLQSLDHLFEI